MWALATSASFLSAMLLFVLEPMLGKRLLPHVGGTAAVWSALLALFQALLLAGYLYAYALVRWVPSRWQGRVHLGVLGVSLGSLLVAVATGASPVLPEPALGAAVAAAPVERLVGLVVGSAGLPFVTLAATGPLLLAWIGRGPAGRSPYPLLAYSNAGSILGLVAYPFVLERLLGLEQQARAWAFAYAAFVLLLGSVVRRARARDDAPGLPEHEPTVPPALRSRALWVALAACPSALLVATTSHLTQEVAPLPLLWVLPLAAYLLSSVFAFAGPRWYPREASLAALAVATGLCWWGLAAPTTLPIPLQIGFGCGALFTASLVCHGELARLRPPARASTAYALAIAAGGVLGGSLVSLVAPLVLDGYWDLPIAMLVAWVLRLGVARGDRRRWLAALVAVIVLVAQGVALAQYVTRERRGAVHASRNFFGVLRVVELGPPIPELGLVGLFHGNTLHGSQFTDPRVRRMPTTYFAPEGGGGLALEQVRRGSEPIHAGVLGLGVGTLAAYGRPGDRLRFYELDPDVIRLARGDGGYFHFLEDSPARVSIVQGDARVELARELAQGQAQAFDVLVLDTFNGDAVPVHLLTLEAGALYFAHLRAGGVLAVNVTNRHLDLRPALAALATHFDAGFTVVDSTSEDNAALPSTWVLISRDRELLARPAVRDRAAATASVRRDLRPWTDDASDVLELLR